MFFMGWIDFNFNFEMSIIFTVNLAKVKRKKNRFHTFSNKNIHNKHFFLMMTNFPAFQIFHNWNFVVWKTVKWPRLMWNFSSSNILHFHLREKSFSAFQNFSHFTFPTFLIYHMRSPRPYFVAHFFSPHSLSQRLIHPFRINNRTFITHLNFSTYKIFQQLRTFQCSGKAELNETFFTFPICLPTPFTTSNMVSGLE